MTHPHTRPEAAIETFPERVAADRERERLAALLEDHAGLLAKRDSALAEQNVEPRSAPVADTFRDAAKLLRDSHPTLPVVDSTALSLQTLMLSHETIRNQSLSAFHPKMRGAVVQGLDEIEAALAQRAAEADTAASATHAQPEQEQ